MVSRIELQDVLAKIESGTKAYYQPPSNLQIQYPCIIYKDKPGATMKVADGLYKYTNRYDLLYITRTPKQSVIPLILGTFSYSSLSDIYVNDGLHHYAFTIYY